VYIKFRNNTRKNT